MNLRGKKLACFVALAHHTRFLLPITEGAEKAGAKAVFFLPLSDYPFERDLNRLGYPYHYIPDFLDDELKKTVAASFNELIETWASRFSQWDGVRLWPLSDQERCIHSAVEEYFCIERFIQKEKPDALIVLHERNRWGKLIGHLANKHGVPMLSLQEGDYHETRLSFSAHTEYSTVDLLWGNACKDTLVKHHCSEDKIVLVGNTHLDNSRKQNLQPQNVARVKKELNLPPNKTYVLVLPDLEWAAVIDEQVWAEFLSNVPENVHLIFKWHPNIKRTTYLKTHEIITKLAPNVTMLYMHDAYELLAVADYGLTLGKTTLALEAVAYGKPLLAMPSFSSGQTYYEDLGVAVPLNQRGDWSNLENILRDGMPSTVRAAVDKYLSHSFYRLDGKAVDRVLEVLGEVITQRGQGVSGVRAAPRFECPVVPGRISFVVPTGHDGEAFIATLTSLAQNVKYPDWEAVVVANDPEAETLLQGLGGDVAFVKSQSEQLGRLYNEGAQIASGEILVFMKPGVVFVQPGQFAQHAASGVAGVAVRNADMSPRCLGLYFDFNYTPRPNTDEARPPDAVGGGVVAVSRGIFEAIGGFDDAVANHLVEVDLCLAARHRQFPVRYDATGLAVVLRDAIKVERSDENWRPRVRFFAKWIGVLPKDEDYLSYAKDLLKV